MKTSVDVRGRAPDLDESAAGADVAWPRGRDQALPPSLMARILELLSPSR